MFGKVKRIFFTGIFGILYVSYIAQLIWVLFCLGNYSMEMLHLKVAGLALLAVEWLVLIAARYLSKRSSSSAQHNGFRRR